MSLIVKDSKMVTLFLKECIQVSKGIIEIIAPHILHSRGSSKTHKCHFTSKWFKQALRKLDIYNYELTFHSFNYFPHRYIPIVTVPREIKLTVKKHSLKSWLA